MPAALSRSLELVPQLQRIRKELGMTYQVLAERSGLGMRTVQRVLADGDASASFNTILKIAHALGASIRLDAADSNDVRRTQAERKANQLVALVQGTSALEAQAVNDSSKRALKRRTVSELLSGSSRRLWSE